MAHHRLNDQFGLSFIELLVTLAISAILASISLPNLKHFIARSEVTVTHELMRNAIHRTRMAAITQQKIIVLCPVDENACGDDWSEGLMIFSDSNNNRIIDDGDYLLERVDFNKKSLKVNWRASAGRGFLRYSPTGMARDFGRFSICHVSDDLTLSHGIVINRQGRLRSFIDRDGDGIVEDIDGKKPEC